MPKNWKCSIPMRMRSLRQSRSITVRRCFISWMRRRKRLRKEPKRQRRISQEAVDEALGTDDDKGMLAENMEKLSEITDQMTEEMTGDLTENIEALPTEKAPEETAEKELSGQKLSTKELSTEEKLQQDAIEKKAYHPFDMRA